MKHLDIHFLLLSTIVVILVALSLPRRLPDFQVWMWLTGAAGLLQVMVLTKVYDLRHQFGILCAYLAANEIALAVIVVGTGATRTLW